MFLGVGDLKALRRAALAKLDERRLAGGRRAVPAARPPAAARAPRKPARGAAPVVVLRVRPGEQPVIRQSVGALCLDLRAGDDLELVSAAHATARRNGLAARVRSPEILFDDDGPWAAAVAAMEWDAVYARHVAALSWAGTVVLEYPLQGLSSRNAALLGASGAVCTPELSLDELRRWSNPGVEALVFGREQVLVSRDTLGLVEGLGATSRGGVSESPLALTLTDARGYAFPVLVAPGETRIFNSRVTNLCGRVAELAAAGVRGLIVVQADLNAEERRAFAQGGLDGLAAFDDRGRFTTGHLFRGVA